ncbi:ras association domain-containing protein 1-like isoform X2 [Rhopilema esculentum]|uniref:ras association domain-containing protein 1-like isoform X2 n=1 Tax=Rhopilema esculentum TaxID=499914 RepID=UPI0031DE6173
MNNDDIELKTLPLHSKTELSTQTSKVLNRKGKAGEGPKSGKVNNKAERGEIIGQVDQSGKSVIGLNSKKLKKVDENMNTSKKTEKKTGLRDWFMGKSTKTQKTKVMQRTDKMMGGPIMERLQKQSAYLSATLQEEESLEGARSTGSASPDHEQLNYEDFVHKKHLLQFHSRPTFCDVCDDFIWGMYRSAIRCKYCKFTCHYRCHIEIDVHCPKAPVKEKSLEDITKETLEFLNAKDGKKEAVEEEAHVTLPKNIASVSELRLMIENYNKSSNLIMILQDDGVFQGYIQVVMCLNRPVNIHADTSDLTMKKALLRSNSRRSTRHKSVVAVNRAASVKSSEGLDRTATMPSSIASSVNAQDGEETIKKERRPRGRSSFYISQNTKKPLHITSTTTAYEVIEALLDKYRVTDNPQKFALYERTEENDCIRVRKIDADEHPLVLSLLWGDARSTKEFSLQENERGDIIWDAFEIPELKNFLVFLNREEEDMINKVRKKYEEQKKLYQQALDFKAENSTESDC